MYVCMYIYMYMYTILLYINILLILNILPFPWEDILDTELNISSNKNNICEGAIYTWRKTETLATVYMYIVWIQMINNLINF